MKDILAKTYELYEEKLKQLLHDVSETKKMLNKLAKDMGETKIPFEDVSVESFGSSGRLRPDHFYNKPLATAVREYLEIGKKAVDWLEIVSGLREGGFDLPKTKEAESEARLTILRNTSNFVLIGDNFFGLKAWYGSSKKDKERNAKAKELIDKRVDEEKDKK